MRFREYLKELKLYVEEQKIEDIENIKKGDKFKTDDEGIFTVTKIKAGKKQKIVLKDEDGTSTTFPDDFDDGDFNYWFKPIKKK